MPNYRVTIDMTISEADAQQIDQAAYGPMNADRLAGWLTHDMKPCLGTIKSMKLKRIKSQGNSVNVPTKEVKKISPDFDFSMGT